MALLDDEARVLIPAYPTGIIAISSIGIDSRKDDAWTDSPVAAMALHPSGELLLCCTLTMMLRSLMWLALALHHMDGGSKNGFEFIGPRSISFRIRFEFTNSE